MKKALILRKDLDTEIGDGLEDALSEIKRIDKRVARTLTRNHGFLSKVPIVRGLFTRAIGTVPLAALESELRRGINNSAISVARLGVKVGEEQARITELKDIYETAVSEDWGPENFLQFIEDNSDLDFVVEVEGQNYDLKEFFHEANNRLVTERQEERKDKYFRWLQGHIRDSEAYMGVMQLTCVVASSLIEDASLSYLGLTQLRGGMEKLQRTLTHLGHGGNASLEAERVISDYGAAHVKGLSNLLDSYREVRKLRGSSSSNFVASLETLQDKIGAIRELPTQEEKKQLSSPLYDGDKE